MKTNKPEEKPTAGAMRAAEGIIECILEALCEELGTSRQKLHGDIGGLKTAAAKAIDRETGLKELVAYARKTADWLERRIAHSDQMAATTTFGSLREACKTDAANYKVQLKQARAALSKHEGVTP